MALFSIFHLLKGVQLYCYELTVSPPNLHIKKPILPNMMVFGDAVFGRY